MLSSDSSRSHRSGGMPEGGWKACGVQFLDRSVALICMHSAGPTPRTVQTDQKVSRVNRAAGNSNKYRGLRPKVAAGGGGGAALVVLEYKLEDRIVRLARTSFHLAKAIR